MSPDVAELVVKAPEMALSGTLETVVPHNIWIPLIFWDFIPRTEPAIFLMLALTFLALI